MRNYDFYRQFLNLRAWIHQEHFAGDMLESGNDLTCYFVEDGDQEFSVDCSHILLLNKVRLDWISTIECPMEVELRLSHFIYPIEPIHDQLYRWEVIDNIRTQSHLCSQYAENLIRNFAWQHAVKVIRALGGDISAQPLEINIFLYGKRNHGYRLDSHEFRGITAGKRKMLDQLAEFHDVDDSMITELRDRRGTANSLVSALDAYWQNEYFWASKTHSGSESVIAENPYILHKSLGNAFCEEQHEWDQMWDSLLDKKPHSPNLTTPPNLKVVPTDDWDFSEESPLKALGYTVGASGWNKTKRHKFLERFLHTPLPSNAPDEWHFSWGKPTTQKRKGKMINHLEGMASLFERQKNSSKFNLAIKQWRADANFIRSLELD